MAVQTRRQHTELVSIPAEPILRERLARLLSESRQVRLLIRTVRELERIEHSVTKPHAADDRHEVTTL